MASAKKATKGRKVEEAPEGWEAVDTAQADIWKGEEGEMIEGMLVGKQTCIRTTDKKPFTLFTLRTDAGDVSLSGALLTKVMEGIRKGARVRITSLGERKLANGRTMRDYSVLVAKGGMKTAEDLAAEG